MAPKNRGKSAIIAERKGRKGGKEVITEIVDSEDSDEEYFCESGGSDTDESVVSDFEWVDSGGSCGEEEEDVENVTCPEEMRGVDVGEPVFMVGMTFKDKDELKRAIDRYAIFKGCNLRVWKSDKRLMKVICDEGCPYSVYASTAGQDAGFEVKTVNPEHTCSRAYKNRRASEVWLAREYKDKIQEIPRFNAKDMKKEVELDKNVSVSIYKCRRAKRRITEDMEGSYKEEFAMLEAYCNELKEQDPGTVVHVDTSIEAREQGVNLFRRMFVCFNASNV